MAEAQGHFGTKFVVSAVIVTPREDGKQLVRVVASVSFTPGKLSDGVMIPDSQTVVQHGSPQVKSHPVPTATATYLGIALAQGTVGTNLPPLSPSYTGRHNTQAQATMDRQARPLHAGMTTGGPGSRRIQQEFCP